MTIKIAVLGCNITATTGKLLASDLNEQLGVTAKYHEGVDGRTIDCLIRWGNGSGVGSIPRLVINKQKGIINCVDKSESMRLFKEADVLIPKPTDHLPCIGRTPTHTQGQGLWLCWLPEQVEEVRREGADHFMEYIPTAQEWRIHVVGGKVPFVQAKYPRRRETSAFGGIQGFRDNWHKNKMATRTCPEQGVADAIKAVKALKMDTGGVDVVEGLNGKCYVLEVNSGPALPTPEVRQPYVDFFMRKIEEVLG